MKPSTKTTELQLIAIPDKNATNDARLRELATAIRCGGNGGCAPAGGFNDLPRLFRCPPYGPN
jgi:hypothetical protein